MKTIQDTDIPTGVPVAVRFRAAAGSRFSAKDAERIGPELLRLKKRYGSLTKDVVVRSAKDAHSPLHKDFEWDDVITSEAVNRASEPQLLIIHELFRTKYARNAKTRGIYRRYLTFIKRAAGLS